MPSTAIASGVLLIVIGVIGYINGVMTGYASLTALIPAAFGLILLVLGAIALSNKDLRMHLMHAAVIVALLGFIIPAVRLISRWSELAYSAAVASQVAMALVCLLFVVLAVKSFIDARRNRAEA